MVSPTDLDLGVERLDAAYLVDGFPAILSAGCDLKA